MSAGTRSAVGALVVAAGMLWAASRLTWVRVESSDGLSVERTSAVLGSTWAPTQTPIALVLVAAVAATLAVKGFALRLVGFVVAVLAVIAAVPAIAALSGAATPERAARFAELPERATVDAVHTAAFGPVLTLVAVAVALGAALVLLRTRIARGLSGKYVRRAYREAVDEPASERELWDALDAGADPTAQPRSSDDAGSQGASAAVESGDDPGDPADNPDHYADRDPADSPGAPLAEATEMPPTADPRKGFGPR